MSKWNRREVIAAGAALGILPAVGSGKQQTMLTEKPADVIAATPGRLLDLHQQGAVNFRDLEVSERHAFFLHLIPGYHENF